MYSPVTVSHHIYWQTSKCQGKPNRSVSRFWPKLELSHCLSLCLTETMWLETGFGTSNTMKRRWWQCLWQTPKVVWLFDIRGAVRLGGWQTPKSTETGETVTWTCKQAPATRCQALPVPPHHFSSFHPETASLEWLGAPSEEETEGRWWWLLVHSCLQSPSLHWPEERVFSIINRVWSNISEQFSGYWQFSSLNSHLQPRIADEYVINSFN